jgi:hypothetical protein
LLLALWFVEPRFGKHLAYIPATFDPVGRFNGGYGIALGWTLFVGCVTPPSEAPAVAPIATVAKPIQVVEMPPPPPTAFADDAIRPCSKTTRDKELTDAFSELANLNGDVGALADASGPKVDAATASLKRLLDLPCFALARRDHEGAFAFDSGAAMKFWWNDGGGWEWLDSYLGGDERIHVSIVPEDARRTLFKEGHETDAIAALLCPSADAGCGRETIGWARRAEASFKRMGSRAGEEPICENEAKQADFPDRWATFRACRAGHASRRTTLPLGRFRAPSDGVVAMVTNTRSGCPEMRVYDLSNGAAIRADCHAAMLGRVPLAAIREAAWMLAFASTGKGAQRGLDRVDVPETIVAGRPAIENVGFGGSFGFGWHSTGRMPWTWLRPKKTSSGSSALVGEMMGDLYRGGTSDTHELAKELLAIAEDGFVVGCAPAFPQLSTIHWSEPGQPIDKSSEFLFDQPFLQPTEQVLAMAKPPPRCPPLP